MISQATRESIKVKVAADGREASLFQDPSLPAEGLTVEELEEMLEAAGVTYGIDRARLMQICAGRPGNGPFTVAVAKMPTIGRDGWIEYRFLKESTPPGVNDAVRVDLRERGLINNVLAGEVLAVIHPPELGAPGMTVRGDLIPAKSGKAAILRPGSNTAAAKDDPHCIAATRDGHAMRTGDNTIVVLETVIIPGNVDFSTGNIDFVGSLIVKGDVIGNFSVKARGSIEVCGNVEDALIEAGRDVMLRKGFLGRGTGRLTARGNVRVSHILNETVISEKDIVITKESVNGTVQAAGSIKSPGAVIAGGSLDALHEIEVMTIGSADGSVAKIRVGQRSRILERIAQIDKELKHSEKQLADVKEAVYRLVKMRIDGVVLSPEKEQILTKLQEVQKALPKKMAALQTEKEGLVVDLQKNYDARIVVRGTIHENVMLEVNGVRKITDGALQAVIFTERGGAIEVRSV
jgi:uncharacterized protein (DUF342 family)